MSKRTMDDAMHGRHHPAAPVRRKGHVPQLAAVPSREAELGWLTHIPRVGLAGWLTSTAPQSFSRGSPSIPTARRWAAEARAGWAQACRDWTPTLAAGLASADALPLAQPLLGLSELPSRPLARHCPAPPAGLQTAHARTRRPRLLPEARPPHARTQTRAPRTAEGTRARAAGSSQRART